MVQVRAVEGVVADLADHDLVLARLEFVDDLPSPRAGPNVLRPDLPLRVPLVVRILGENHLHPGFSSEVEEALYLRDRRFGIGDEEGATLLHEVVVHVHDDKGRFRGVYPDLFADLVPRNLYLHGSRSFLTSLPKRFYPPFPASPAKGAGTSSSPRTPILREMLV